MNKADYEESWKKIIHSLDEFSTSNVEIKYRPIPVEVLRNGEHFAITEESIKMNIENFTNGEITDKEHLSIMKEIIDDGDFIRNVGLSPIYLYSETNNDIIITSKEYYEGRLH